MFSIAQKRHIAHQVQALLRETQHPELPHGEIEFHLRVEGAESWSFADIRNNGAVSEPTVNPHNEAQAKFSSPLPINESRVDEKDIEAVERRVGYGHGGWGEFVDPSELMAAVWNVLLAKFTARVQTPPTPDPLCEQL